MSPANEELLKRSNYRDVNIGLKEMLDSISSPSINLSSLQQILKSGPSRKISVQDESITIQMLESGSVYQWNVGDPRTAVACLVATGTYEPIETKILKQLTKGAKLIVDIGANVGYYTVELAKIMRTDGQLLSFEPVAATFSQLEKNVELNAIENKVRMFQLGVSNSASHAEIYLPRKSGSSAASLRNLHPDEEFESQNIQTTTLDYIFESLGISECSLIKIDVEGAELQVIEGALATIAKFHPVIFAELLRKWSEAFSYSPNKVLQVLSNLGYSCWGVSETLREITLFEETDVETNFLFVHNEKVAETIENLRKVGFDLKVN